MRKQTTIGIVRTTLLGFAGLGAAAWLSTSLMAGGQATGQAPHQMPMPSKGRVTNAQPLANSTTHAPTHARPATDGAQPASPRPRRPGWTSLPARPDPQGSDPMCVDQSWP